jgi:hypothetical protein
MDMQDLSILIAPRPLAIVTGNVDPIFPLEGVKRGFETVKKIYKKLNAIDKCNLIIGDGGHMAFPDLTWPNFNKYR